MFVASILKSVHSFPNNCRKNKKKWEIIDLFIKTHLLRVSDARSISLRIGISLTRLAIYNGTSFFSLPPSHSLFLLFFPPRLVSLGWIRGGRRRPSSLAALFITYIRVRARTSTRFSSTQQQHATQRSERVSELRRRRRRRRRDGIVQWLIIIYGTHREHHRKYHHGLSGARGGRWEGREHTDIHVHMLAWARGKLYRGRTKWRSWRCGWSADVSENALFLLFLDRKHVWLKWFLFPVFWSQWNYCW